MSCGLIETWRIAKTDLWDKEFPDLVESAFIRFDGLRFHLCRKAELEAPRP